MKAVVFEQYGSPEVLHLTDIQKPIPKSNEVLVRIHATSVTAEDPKMRGFNHPSLLKIPVGLMFGFRKPKYPVLGIELSGVIESVGSNVRKYKVGQHIFGYTGLNFGAYAEYKCIPENGLIYLKPKNMTFEESACLVNGPLSSLTFIKKKGKIKNGDKVLIYGASGAVGTSAIQLAKYFGAEVTGVCSTKNLSLVESIGADYVIDRTKQVRCATGLRPLLDPTKPGSLLRPRRRECEHSSCPESPWCFCRPWALTPGRHRPPVRLRQSS